MIKRISTVTARSLLKSLVIISPLLLLAFPVKAQTIPACRNITPSAGRVCYTEHPFSARQRDEGGTRTYNFIVERVAQNWVIIDYEVIREGGFGAVSNPTGSIVSSNGNASIVNVTQSETQRLSEVKSQLEAKAQGCYPPVCGQIQGQLSSVDREAWLCNLAVMRRYRLVTQQVFHAIGSRVEVELLFRAKSKSINDI
jgi:hypothetical protein